MVRSTVCTLCWCTAYHNSAASSNCWPIYWHRYVALRSIHVNTVEVKRSECAMYSCTRYRVCYTSSVAMDISPNRPRRRGHSSTIVYPADSRSVLVKYCWNTCWTVGCMLYVFPSHAYCNRPNCTIYARNAYPLFVSPLQLFDMFSGLVTLFRS